MNHPDDPRTVPTSLEEQITAAELRVIERDARVVRTSAQLGRRLSSRSTQARLLLAGVAGLAAVVALARLARRPAAPPLSTAKRTAPDAVPQPPPAPVWLQWLPLVLQLLTASTRQATPPVSAGLIGWVGPRLAAAARALSSRR